MAWFAWIVALAKHVLFLHYTDLTMRRQVGCVAWSGPVREHHASSLPSDCSVGAYSKGNSGCAPNRSPC